jgi:probable metal-binding protein
MIIYHLVFIYSKAAGMTSTHGHELMEWLGRTGPLPRAELLAAAENEFGADCRFHTCSQVDLTGEQLLDFLLSKGKVAQDDHGLRLAMEPCAH